MVRGRDGDCQQLALGSADAGDFWEGGCSRAGEMWFRLQPGEQNDVRIKFLIFRNVKVYVE